MKREESVGRKVIKYRNKQQKILLNGANVFLGGDNGWEKEGKPEKKIARKE